MGRKKIQISRIQDERNRQTLNRKEHKGMGGSSHSGQCNSADSDDDSLGDGCCTPPPAASFSAGGSDVDIGRGSSTVLPPPAIRASDTDIYRLTAAAASTTAAPPPRLFSTTASSGNDAERHALMNDVAQRAALFDQISPSLLASSYAHLLNSNMAAILNLKANATIADVKSNGPQLSRSNVHDDDLLPRRAGGGSHPDLSFSSHYGAGRPPAPQPPSSALTASPLMAPSASASLMTTLAAAVTASTLAMSTASLAPSSLLAGATNVNYQRSSNLESQSANECGSAPFTKADYLRAYTSLSSLPPFSNDFQMSVANLAMLRDIESAGLLASWSATHQNALNTASNGLMSASSGVADPPLQSRGMGSESPGVSSSSASAPVVDMQALRARLRQSHLQQQRSDAAKASPPPLKSAPSSPRKIDAFGGRGISRTISLNQSALSRSIANGQSSQNSMEPTEPALKKSKSSGVALITDKKSSINQNKSPPAPSFP